MDPRFLHHYNRELQFAKEMGGEFAREFPKIAGRLGMDGFEVADPYVERLLEGFAFLTARLQLKLDDEFPRFTQHLLDMVYPHYLAPTPSMAIVQLQPNPKEGALARGVTIPRGTAMRSLIGKDEQTACEYRTAHETTLWPIEVAGFEYRSNLGDVLDLGIDRTRGSRGSGARLRLRTTNGMPFNKLSMEQFTVFLRGESEITSRLYEQLLGHAVAVYVKSGPHTKWVPIAHDEALHPVGFADDEALLPHGPQSFQGYRLLQEYFAFRRRFLFVRFAQLGPMIQACGETEIEIVVLFDSNDAILDNTVEASNLALFCTPVVNLFPRRADRIHLSDRFHEYHIVPDRTRPMDFEVHGISEVVGHGPDVRQRFSPFYACNESTAGEQDTFYTLYRMPRQLSERQKRAGPRSSYVGSEVFISLVDGQEGPFRTDLKQLALETLCTNRDLPLHMPLGQGTTDFTLQTGAPVQSIRCVAGPTQPKDSHAHGASAWRLISHLSLNYLSLTDGPAGKGAAALRELLALYADQNAATLRREIDSVLSAESKPIIRHLPIDGMLAFGRGVEVTLTCDESGFSGAGAFLLGSVLERFFARYVSINAFTETVLRTVQRGEVMRWQPRIGQTQAL
jgi:type VI secretion system protein ImpG